MKYVKSKPYDIKKYRERMMGPNPIKLNEELLADHCIPRGALVMDLGSGQGVTSVFLAKEYGFSVIAADLWSDPTDNKRFFDSLGLTPAEILPVKADANNLPFAHETFEAVVCTDAYNYFGRDPEYLEKRLLPYIRHGGMLYIVIPGMKKDCHDNLPQELLLSWGPAEWAYIHDIAFWTDIINRTKGMEVMSIHEMESNEEVWADWLETDNPYAVNDRKSMDAGGGKYLNFIAIIIKRK